MAKTEAQFLAAYERQKAANLRQRAAYAAARAALNGKSAAMQTIKGAIDVSRGQVSALVPRAEALISSPGTGGGTPPVSTNASLALMKSAILAAPTTYASIPSGNTITVIQGAPNELPAFPGGVGAPVLHYFTPPNTTDFRGPAGSPDVLTVAKFAAPETFSPAYPTLGFSKWTQNGGANVLISMWCQEIGAHVGGFTTNSRYFAFQVRFGGKDVTVTIDGILQPTITVNANDCWTIVDTNATGSKNIVLSSGGNEFAGIAIPTGATITPYDHLAGKFRINCLHDSWGQRRDYENRNQRFPDLLAKLLGAHSVGGSVRGGTGYAIGDNPATDPQRRIDLNAGSPHAIFDFMQVNDGDPQTTPGLQPAVRTVMERIRADNPNAVYVKVCWTSKGSTATTTGGETRKRDLFRAEWDRIPGPKFFFDCMAGTWYADKGDGVIKQRSSALGPMITGEGSAASPTGSGNADVIIDNNDGRHETSQGVVYTINYLAAFAREALAAV